MAGALILTAELGQEDFARLDALRREHYPADRNAVPAHLTLFHALPPSAEAEARTRLAGLTLAPAPIAWIEGLLDLGGGVAFRVASEDLDSIRIQLADAFHGLLGTQDGRGWRPHITIQNKVAPKTARELKQALERDFQPRPLGIAGLSLQRYLGGPWEPLGSYRFR